MPLRATAESGAYEPRHFTAVLRLPMQQNGTHDNAEYQQNSWRVIRNAERHRRNSTLFQTFRPSRDA